MGQTRRVRRQILLLNDQVPLGIGSGIWSTGIIDIISEQECGVHGVERLRHDEYLQESLGVAITTFKESFDIRRYVTTDVKGFVKLIGIYKNGSFESGPEPEEQVSVLYTTCPNYLMRGFYPPPEDDGGDSGSEVNLLLAQYIQDNHPRLTTIVRERGNFKLTYKREEGKETSYYYIKPYAEITTKYMRARSSDEEDYRDPGKYTMLTKEQRVPFSKTYLMTGGRDGWLCLELDIGSPSIGEVDIIEGQPTSIIETHELEQIIRRYTRKSGIKFSDFLGSRAQGLVAVGYRDSGGGQRERVFLKLPDPAHADKYSTKEIISSLQEMEIIPNILKVYRLNDVFKRRASIF